MVSLYKLRRSIGFHRLANIHLNLIKLRPFTYFRRVLCSRLPSKASEEANAVCCTGYKNFQYLYQSQQKALGFVRALWHILANITDKWQKRVFIFCRFTFQVPCSWLLAGSASWSSRRWCLEGKRMRLRQGQVFTILFLCRMAMLVTLFLVLINIFNSVR